MLVRGDAFQVFIQATSVSLQAPGRILNYVHTGVKTLKIVNTLQIYLFRYLTPPPQSEKKGVCLGGGAYPSRDDYTVFNIFIHIIKSWPGIFTIFTVFTQYRFESLWAYGIQYERNLSDSVGHASLVRIWMFKSIIMCLFQMRDVLVFCNYQGFFTIFFA